MLKSYLYNGTVKSIRMSRGFFGDGRRMCGKGLGLCMSVTGSILLLHCTLDLLPMATYSHLSGNDPGKFRNQFGLRYGVTSRVSHGRTFSTTAWVSVSGIRASEVFHLCGFHGFTRCVRARTLRSIINQQPRLACKIVVYCCVVLR